MPMQSRLTSSLE